jgi:hypothetical protein
VTCLRSVDKQSSTSEHNVAHSQLALKLLRLVPDSLWTRPIGVDDTSSVKDEASWTTQLYGTASPPLTDLLEKSKATLPTQLVSKVFQLSSKALSNSLIASEELLVVFEIVYFLLDQEPPALKDVEGRAWIGSIVKSLSSVPSFAVVDAMISSVLKATRCSAFQSHLDQSHSSIMTAMLDTVSSSPVLLLMISSSATFIPTMVSTTLEPLSYYGNVISWRMCILSKR